MSKRQLDHLCRSVLLAVTGLGLYIKLRKGSSILETDQSIRLLAVDEWDVWCGEKGRSID